MLPNNHIFIAACMQLIDWAPNLDRLKDIGLRLKKEKLVSEHDIELLRNYWLSRKTLIEEGRAVHEDLAEKHRLMHKNLAEIAIMLAKPQHVLLVLHPDGWMETYSNRLIRTHFYQLPPDADTAEQRIQAEHDLEESLPLYLREMYAPNAIKDTPGKTNARQVRLKTVTGKAIYEWVSGDNKWDSEDTGVG